MYPFYFLNIIRVELLGDDTRLLKGPFIYVLGTHTLENVLETCSRYTSIQISSTVKRSRYPLRLDF